MKKIVSFLGSMKLMLVLTLIFAIASGWATFIENDYGTVTAKAMVYNSRWFELIQLLLTINLIINIFNYKMYKKEKFPIFLFHVAFLFIVLGSLITRYVGFEGVLHLREGDIKNHFLSSESYIQLKAKKDGKIYANEQKILISKLGKNWFKVALDIDGKKATLEYEKFIPFAQKELVEDKTSPAKIKMMIVYPNSKPNVVVLDEKDFKLSPNVEFVVKDDKVYLNSKISWTTTVMATGKSISHKPQNGFLLETKRMYDFGEFKLTPIMIYAHAREKLTSKKITGGKNIQSRYKSAIKAKLSYDGKSRDVVLFGYGDSRHGDVLTTSVDGVDFAIEWGAREYALPFAIKLKDFELKRYPGSNSPASYASFVKVLDSNKSFDFKIYMNHVLDYKGYRFFQSSYDMDEKGSVLSVNHDPGKLPTYIGYFLLSLGLLLNFFNPKSRFRKLARAIQKETTLKSFLLFFMLAFSSSFVIASPLDEAKVYNYKHGELFGDLLVQKYDGRIVTMDTFSKDLLVKLSKKKSLYNLSSNQIILGMITAPKIWQDIPVIRVKHDRVKKLLGLSLDKKYATYNDFFDYKSSSAYKLLNLVEEANHKKPTDRNEFDRALIRVDERLNIAYLIYTGDILRIIPKENDPTQKWYSVKDALLKFPPQESMRIKTLFLYYFAQVDEAKKSGDWKKADEAVKLINRYQKKIGGTIIPSQTKLKAEEMFAKIGLFNILAIVYFVGGFILLVAIFYKLVKPKSNIQRAVFVGMSIFYLAFLTQTVGMGIRWYIGGHAPWSNAYESMLLIAWSMGLAGVVFRRYSLLAPSLTGLIASATLLTTFLAQMDPQITTLVPVLSSYWLNIHVSVLTSSYGFLGLSMILGAFSLVLFVLRNPKNPQLDKSIKEATKINEMTMILGLSLLVIGNFLGGVWANESWGRYWGWDPKETWAWVSILVYVIVTHVRFVPWFNKNYDYKFAVLSLVSYASIIMTYAGVNFYLSGMHSYAAGEPVPIPSWVYVIAILTFVLIMIASRKRELK